MKRFTATEKWDDAWFQNLSINAKLIVMYMRDTCDAAGVWEANTANAEFQIGFTKAAIPIDWSAIIQEINAPPPKNSGPQVTPTIPQLRLISGTKWWLTKFIDYQWGELHEKMPRHFPVFKSLMKHGLWEAFLEMYPNLVSQAARDNPPTSMPFPGSGNNAPRALPTLVEVVNWPEGKTDPPLPPEQVKLFFYHYQAKGWKVNGRRSEDFPSLLSKWKTTWEIQQKAPVVAPAAPRKETVWELQRREEAITKEIQALCLDTYKPEDSPVLKIKPEAIEKIKALRTQRDSIQKQIREAPQ